MTNFSEVKPIDQLIQKMKDQKISFSKELIYVHTDKPYYMAGENIYYKAYLREASTFFLRQISKTVYVELIDPKNEIISKKLIRVDGEHNHGDFKLSTELEQGTYQLRAYTNWMRNFGMKYFYEQDIKIFQIDMENRREELASKTENQEIIDRSSNGYQQDYDLQFFAEAGHLVAGVPSKIGFKLLNENGLGQDFSATVFDNDGTKVEEVSSDHLGMGSLMLMPESGKSYYAILNKDLHKNQPKKYPLPSIELQGTTLKVFNSRDDLWVVQVISTDGKLGEGAFLLTSQRGNPLFGFDCTTSNTSIRIKVPMDNIQNGIVNFTLFDKNSQPILERKSFKYIPKVPVLETDQPAYKKREKVTLDITLPSNENGAKLAEASVTILDKNLIDLSVKEKTLESEWLFKEGIKGNIEQPKWYFDDFSKEKSHLIDNLMITQGYEKPLWVNHLEDTLKMDYLPERGISILGKTSSIWNKDKIRVSEITMTSLSSEKSFVDQVITDDEGQFTFTGMVFYDTTEFVFSAKKYNVKRAKTTENKNVDISLYGVDSPVIYPKSTQEFTSTFNALAAYEKEILEIEKINRAFDTKTIILDEIEIFDEADRSEFDRPGKLHSNAQTTIVIDQNTMAGMNMWQYLQTTPRASMLLRRAGVSGVGASLSMDEDGQVSELDQTLPIILDGFPVDMYELQSLMASDISFIEILDPIEASIYMNSSNGLIAMYSNTGNLSPNYTVYGINSFKHPGFYMGKEFYTPKYDVQKEEHIKPDHRITLDWIPNVAFDSLGKAQIEFYTDDKTTDYVIEIEGIHQDGELFYSTHDFLNK
ncbi:hypothetical protein NH26_20220 [Flammeovirga pacifica]|uniref:Macroglobulin domain-containing protein n=2 Tax=Flammeovirga pacifica TaxID=915059 RepID=A0A1S1YSE0_FLAPC|nr:hypothetical protein NH26_20220 [Flammeovirga pacifica]